MKRLDSVVGGAASLALVYAVWVPEHQRPDLYFLTDINTPFVQDGTRDGEHVREWMHKVFVEELRAQHRPYHCVSGTRGERSGRAVGYIEKLLTEFRRG